VIVAVSVGVGVTVGVKVSVGVGVLDAKSDVRGWLGPELCVNAWGGKKLHEWLKSKRGR